MLCPLDCRPQVKISMKYAKLYKIVQPWNLYAKYAAGCTPDFADGVRTGVRVDQSYDHDSSSDWLISLFVGTFRTWQFKTNASESDRLPLGVSHGNLKLSPSQPIPWTCQGTETIPAWITVRFFPSAAWVYAVTCVFIRCQFPSGCFVQSTVGVASLLARGALSLRVNDQEESQSQLEQWRWHTWQDSLGRSIGTRTALLDAAWTGRKSRRLAFECPSHHHHQVVPWWWSAAFPSRPCWIQPSVVVKNARGGRRWWSASYHAIRWWSARNPSEFLAKR